MPSKKKNFEKDDESSMRQNIIMAAITCIEKYGFNALTIRRIAKEAGVNVAAINYYFGSKAKLIDEVLRHTTYIGFEENIIDFLVKYKETPHKALEMFFLEFLGGGMKYPNLVRIHFYETFINNNYKTYSAKRLTSFLNDFEKIVSSLLPGNSPNDFKMKMIQLWSSVFFLVIFSGIFCDFARSDLNDPEWQKAFVADLLKRYFPD